MRRFLPLLIYLVATGACWALAHFGLDLIAVAVAWWAGWHVQPFSEQVKAEMRAEEAYRVKPPS